MEPSFNEFQTFNLSEEERIAGTALHPLQIAVMQNRRSAIAQNLINLEYDPEHKEQLGLDRAMLTGQKQIIDMIIIEANIAIEKSQSQPSQED